MRKIRDAKIAEEDECEKQQDYISELEKRENACGFFKWREKKNLQAQIIEEQSKLEDMKEKAEKAKAEHQKNLNAQIYDAQHSGQDIIDEYNKIQERISEITIELTKERPDIEEVQTTGSKNNFGDGIDIAAIKEDIKRPHYKPSMKKIYTLALQLGEIYSEEYKNSEYTVDYLVEAEKIDPDADKDAYPIHFLFSKAGKPILAVVCCTKAGYKRPRVVMTQMVCKKHGIKYMRYFCDGGYPNTEDYIKERTREALNGNKITWQNGMLNPQTGRRVNVSKLDKNIY